MKRARDFTASKFTALRPISRRQVHSFMLEKLENIQNGDQKKRIKLSKTLTAEVANLATSDTEKVLAISCAIASAITMVAQFCWMARRLQYQMLRASAYVLTPYLLQHSQNVRLSITFCTKYNEYTVHG